MLPSIELKTISYAVSQPISIILLYVTVGSNYPMGARIGCKGSFGDYPMTVPDYITPGDNYKIRYAGTTLYIRY